MIKWTEPATERFDDYCSRLRKSLAGDAVDANEVIDDLRRHIDEEARASGLPILDRETLTALLAKFGDPAHLGDAPDLPQAPGGPKPADTRSGRWKPGAASMIFGVFLPAVTILFELSTGMSAGALFDPMPTWFHVLLVALVPVSNAILWEAVRCGNSRRSTLIGWMSASAIGINLVYALLFLSFAPFAVFGIIFFGLGLLPLSPLLALPATIHLRTRFRRSAGLKKLPGLGGGLLLTLGILLVMHAQTFITYQGLVNAADEDETVSRNGVRMLRAFGDDETMLRACYGFLRGFGGSPDPVRFLATGDRHISPEQAREVYYRVTGSAFNSRHPPRLYNRSGRWQAIDEEFTWDNALGGDEVAQRVKGLSLLGSRLDAVAEPDTGTVYCEWTMEFRNVHSLQREARAQIALPPGGVVSRLTLWVDGEEREAAFAGRSAVKEAYREIAVVRRRDPVLVTTAGPDRILMQCFPVPPDGGTMKVRVGITAPLLLDSPESARYIWPRILERNFSMKDGFEHSLWFDSAEAVSSDMENVATAREDGFSWQAAASDAELSTGTPTLKLSRKPIETAWTPALEEGRIIVQSIEKTTLARPAEIVFALDGSAGMEPCVSGLSEALSTLDDDVRFSLVTASDDPDVIAANENPPALTRDELRSRIAEYEFAGGQDNLPALVEAWNAASVRTNSIVVWIHAPQGVRLKSDGDFRQRVERSNGRVPVYEYQAANGADRVVETMDGLPNVRHVPRTADLRADLESLFRELCGKKPVLVFHRTQTAGPPAVAVKAASRHIERLWARDEVARLLKARHIDAAVALAAKQQIVTPCSGAVVLENPRQYEENNLNPVAAESVPSIPEPGTMILLLLGTAALLIRMRKRRMA